MYQNNIKVLGFDVFGTVVDWRTGIARESEAFFKRNTLTVDPYVFADTWRSLYQSSMEPCRRGTRQYTRLDILHREMLITALASHGINQSKLSKYEIDELAFAWRKLDPWPDVVNGLLRLKKKYVLVPISNGNIALILEMAKRSGIPWDAILGSEVTQAYKPEPLAYLGTVDVLGIEPNELCLVAAHNYDLLAAQQCGLATAFVYRKTEHGENQKIDLAPEGDWDLVADSFLDLADKLDC